MNPNPTVPLSSYFRTDMAAELFRAQRNPVEQTNARGSSDSTDGIHYETSVFHGVRCEKLSVCTEEASSRFGKSIGTYYTVHTGDLRFLDRTAYDACAAVCNRLLGDAIRTLLSKTAAADMRITDNPVSGAGESAESRHAVSPEWDQGHIDIFRGQEQSEASLPSNAEGMDIPTASDPCIDTVTDVPPVPLSEESAKVLRSVLVVGLGNPELTPDALGPMTVRRIHVTRHLTGAASLLPTELRKNLPSLSAFCPMVLGQTGIETQALVRGAVQAAKPELVILIDALASSEIGHLARTVQISTTGIHPGGGIGNKREPLTEESLGVPVLTIGVPTVIASSTMVYRALEGAGLLPQEGENPKLHSILRETFADSGSSYVSPKDIDQSVQEFSRFLAETVNSVVLGKELAEEWFSRV